MAEALMIIPIVSALTGTSMMAMLTMGPEGGIIKAVKKKVNSISYDDQIWNKSNTSTGQLSVQFTALTQWMSTMAQYGNTRKRQLNSVRLELSLPIRREFKDNDGKIKVLEPYPLVPHYYHVPRVGCIWRFSLSHFPALAEHRAKRYPGSNANKKIKKKIDKQYSVWIESIGYKATDDVTAFKITWPKDNPTLFNYWNTMIWMLTRYDFNTGLVMENIRAAMQPNPHPLLENDVLALFAQVKEDDLKIQKEMKAKEEAIVSPYSSGPLQLKSKQTCQTTTLDVPLSFNYRSNHPKSEKPKKRRVHHDSSDDEHDENERKVVLVLKTSSTTKKKTKEIPKATQSLKIEKSSGISGLFSKKDKENTTPTNKKKMNWANGDDDEEDGMELSENPLIRASLSSVHTASMLSRISMQDDNEYSTSRSLQYESPLAEITAQSKKSRKNKSQSKNKKAALNTMNLINNDISSRPSVAV